MPRIEFEEIKDFLQSFADDAIKYGSSKYPKIELELYMSYGYSSDLSLEHGIPKTTDGFGGGIGVRVGDKKMHGFASVSGLNQKIINETIDDAVATMKAMNSTDERFEGFADPVKRSSKDGLIYKPFLDLTSADLIQNVTQITSQAEGLDERIVSISGNSGLQYYGFAVANTRGINASSTIVASYIVFQCIAQEKGTDKRKIGFEFDVSRSRDLKWDGLAKKAVTHATSLLETEDLGRNEQITTIWEPRVSSTYFTSSLATALNGRLVVEGRSRFADRIGEVIAQPDFNLIDDGQLPEGINTSSIDAEGIPRKTTNLIEKGMLKHFLFDTYYARIFGTESTGNAVRSGEGFSRTPNIGVTTLIVPEGTESTEKALSDVKLGIYIQDYIMGLGHSDPISGDFSAVATQSFLVKEGEIKGALNPVTIGGNFYKGLNQIKTICSDPLMTPWNIKVPTVIFDGFTVSG